MNILGE